MAKKIFNNKFLRSSVNVYRKSLSRSDIGDFNENSDTLIYSSVPAAVRPVVSDAVFESEGIEHFQTHLGVINKENGNDTINLLLDDIIEDTETGIKHTVIGIQEFYPINSKFSDIHHIEIALEAVGDTGSKLISAKTVLSKVRISKVFTKTASSKVRMV